MSEKNKPRLNSFSKGRELKYNELKIQNYLLPNQLNIKQCKLLFSLRAQMIPVRCNYSHSYDSLTCPVCEDTAHQDTQSHILQCKRSYLRVLRLLCWFSVNDEKVRERQIRPSSSTTLFIYKHRLQTPYHHFIAFYLFKFWMKLYNHCWMCVFVSVCVCTCLFRVNISERSYETSFECVMF